LLWLSLAVGNRLELAFVGKEALEGTPFFKGHGTRGYLSFHLLVQREELIVVIKSKNSEGGYRFLFMLSIFLLRMRLEYLQALFVEPQNPMKREGRVGDVVTRGDDNRLPLTPHYQNLFSVKIYSDGELLTVLALSTKIRYILLIIIDINLITIKILQKALLSISVIVVQFISCELLHSYVVGAVSFRSSLHSPLNLWGYLSRYLSLPKDSLGSIISILDSLGVLVS